MGWGAAYKGNMIFLYGLPQNLMRISLGLLLVQLTRIHRRKGVYGELRQDRKPLTAERHKAGLQAEDV